MSTFRAYLEGNSIGDFQPNELSEVLLLIYSVLKWAVRDDADTVILDPNGFSWSKQGSKVGEFSTPGTAPNPSYFEAFQRVVQRDQVIRANVKEITASPQKLIYGINS